MKNLLFVFASILLDAIPIGCECSSQHYEDIYLNVSANTVMLDDPKGASGSFRVSANSYWSISNGVEWLKVSPNSGNNDAEIIVTATKPNESIYDRSSTVRISCGGMGIEVRVVQKGKK